jgi:hypothetical protein
MTSIAFLLIAALLFIHAATTNNTSAIGAGYGGMFCLLIAAVLFIVEILS